MVEFNSEHATKALRRENASLRDMADFEEQKVRFAIKGALLEIAGLRQQNEELQRRLSRTEEHVGATGELEEDASA